MSKWITIVGDDPTTFPTRNEIVLWKFSEGSDLYGKVYAGFMRSIFNVEKLGGDIPAIVLIVDCEPNGHFTEYVYGAEAWRPMIGVDE